MYKYSMAEYVGANTKENGEEELASGLEVYDGIVVPKEVMTAFDNNYAKMVEMSNKVDALWLELESDTRERINRYTTLYEFVKGNQWSDDRKENGANLRTHNLLDPITRKYASLLMSEVPQVVVPRESEIKPIMDVNTLLTPPQETEYDEKAPLEFDRSEAIEKILRECLHTHNKVKKEFQRGALNGSKLGDTVFFVYFDKKKGHPCIEEIFPGNVRLAFTSQDSRKIEGAIAYDIASLNSIERTYGWIASPEEAPETNVWNMTQFQTRPSAIVKKYWDEEWYIVKIGNAIVKAQKNKYKCVPFFHIPNLETGADAWGVSDIEQALEVQVSYNEALTDEANLSKMYAEPKIVIQNPGKTNLDNFKKQGAMVIPVSGGAQVQPLAFTGQIFPMQNRIARIKGDMHDITSMPQAAFGNAQGSIVTGVAMTAQFSPVLQTIRTKMINWDVALEDMAAFILELYERFGGTYMEVEGEDGEKRSITYEEIIDGWRKTEWQWSSKIPRDDSIFIQNEILKMNSRLQSRARTMTNLGITSPQDELNQIALEENNPTLNPELAIKKAQMEAQTGEGSEPEMIQRAEEENQQMAAGQQVPVAGANKKEHQIHIEVHTNYLSNLPEETDPAIFDIFDAHIAEHEAALAQSSNGQGGARIGAGRPEEEGGPMMQPGQVPQEVATQGGSPEMAAMMQGLAQAAQQG